MIATLVIFMREGIEASMIVAILLAYLNRIGQRRYFRDVFIGVGAALALAAGGGIAAYLTIRQYDGSNVQTVFETGTYLLAAAVLTYMTFWMRGHARGLSGELRARADAALTRGARTGLALLAFQAVGREGLETVVFTLAIIFSTSTQGALLGAVVGLAISLTIAFFIYRLGHKLNLSRFFTVIGALLMFFAAGLLADAVENMQQLGWLNFLTQPAMAHRRAGQRGQHARRHRALLPRLRRQPDPAPGACLRRLPGHGPVLLPPRGPAGQGPRRPRPRPHPARPRPPRPRPPRPLERDRRLVGHAGRPVRRLAGLTLATAPPVPGPRPCAGPARR